MIGILNALFFFVAFSKLCEVPKQSEKTFLQQLRDDAYNEMIAIAASTVADSVIVPVGKGRFALPVEMFTSHIPGIGDLMGEKKDMDALFEVSQCLSDAVDALSSRVDALEAQVKKTHQLLCTTIKNDKVHQLRKLYTRIENVMDEIGTETTSVCGVGTNGFSNFTNNPCDNVYFRKSILNELKEAFNDVGELFSILTDELQCFDCKPKEHIFEYRHYNKCDCPTRLCEYDWMETILLIRGQISAQCPERRDAVIHKRPCRSGQDDYEEDCTNKPGPSRKEKVIECETKWDKDSYMDGYFDPVKKILFLAMNVWSQVVMIGHNRPEIDFWILVPESNIMNSLEYMSTTLNGFRQATADHDYWKTGGTNIYPVPTDEDVEQKCGDVNPGYVKKIYQDPNDYPFNKLKAEATCVGDASIALELILEDLDIYHHDWQTIISGTYEKIDQAAKQRLSEELCANRICPAPQCYEPRTCNMGFCSSLIPITSAFPTRTYCNDGDPDTAVDICDGYGNCIGTTFCGSHQECPDSRPFCKYNGIGPMRGFTCESCDECHYCHDGFDGTCGSCGSEYPTQEDSSCGTEEERISVESDETSDPVPSECIPDTEAKCRSVAAAQSLSDGGLGYDFVGSWSNKPKGCYAYSDGTYSGRAYFNNGGYGSATDLTVTELDVYRVVDLNCGSHDESECTPHTESACREAAIASGLSLGNLGNGGSYEFVGTWNHKPKGCYVYKSGTHTGQAYFNTGGFGDGTEILPFTSGTEAQKQSTHNLVRVPNFNCCQNDNANDCFQDGVAQGFQNGGSGSWGNTPKGCYVYWDGNHEGKVFYNTGGQGSALEGLPHASESQHRIAQWTCQDAGQSEEHTFNLQFNLG